MALTACKTCLKF